MGTLHKLYGPLAVVALLGATFSTGCATKKYVRNQVAPIDQRVTQVTQTANQNKDAIAKLGEKEETDISRVNEQAMSAQNAAKDAANAAQQADQKAVEAQTMARNVGDRVTQLNTTFQDTIQKIDNYQLVSTEKVLFKFNSANLTKEAKEKLDTTAQSMANNQHYVIEVQGFTDTTGKMPYNLALSQRRADAVVRYLMVQHKVPLYRIHVVGLGEQEPAADNKTRAGRQENRRVEVRTYAANWSGGTSTGQTSQFQGNQMMQQDQTQTTSGQTTTRTQGESTATQEQSNTTTQTQTDQSQTTAPIQETPPMQTQPGQPVQTQPTQPQQVPTTPPTP